MRIPGSIVISGLLLYNLTTAPPAFAQPELVWASGTGSTGTEQGLGVAVDATGNIYSTGYFFGTVDFDPGSGVSELISTGRDIFITKVDADGKLLWAKKIGDSSTEDVKAIATDAAGNVYITGFFTGTVDFDPGAGTFNLINGSTFFPDIFIVKLDTDGEFGWANRVGTTSGSDEATSIAIDVGGNVIVTGRFTNTPTFGAAGSISSSGSFDAFVTKLDASGNFLWARKLGGVSSDGGDAGAVDVSGNIVVTGYFQETADFDPGAGVFNLTTTGGVDVFITKLNASGDFVWAKKLGGSDNERSTAITTDASGNILTTGYFNHTTDFDPDDVTSFNLTSYNSSSFDYFNDVFISKLNSSGAFVWAKQLGGDGDDLSSSIITDALGNVYLTGSFVLTADFDPDDVTSFNLTSQGGQDAFITKLNNAGNLVWAVARGGPNADNSNGIALDVSLNVVTVGSFIGRVDFAPGSCVFNLQSHNAGMDFSLLKLSQSALPLPTITNVSTLAGPAGTSVTIEGTNFSTNPVNNIVYFHDLQADVSVSTATEISVTVPTGALTGILTVTIGCQTASAGTFTVTGTCNISTPERNALIDLYNSTNGATWVNGANWLSADESTWFGVTVAGCRVTGLNLSANQLVGSLPASFFNLNYLEVLHLNDNAISGGMPAYLFDNVMALRELHLQNNAMSGLISSSIGNLTELRELQIQHNSFSFNIGILEPCINLEILDVEDNDINDGIPSSIGSLINLKHLNLFSTIAGYDSQIPPELGNLTLLEYLDLSSCRVSGSIPVELKNLTALKTLRLYGNSLEGSVDEVLEGLVNLEELNLANNYFTGSFPVAIETMVDLKVLDLSENGFSGAVQINFGNLTQLHTLNLFGNYLSGDFPSSLGLLTSLNTVNLSDNRFTSIPVINAYEVFVQNNRLDFGDLEPNMGVSDNFSYSPQRTLPGGGLISFSVGGTITIPFTTPGTDNFYQWFKMADPIAGATSATFTLSPATATDAGLYYVEVTSGVVPDLTLKFEPFLATYNACTSVTPAGGDLDLSFVPDNNYPVASIALQSTGKIIASTLTGTGGGGYTYYDIVRFNTDGSYDNTFTTFTHNWGGSSSQLIIYPNNYILNYYPDVYSEGEQIFQLEPDGVANSIRLYPDLYGNHIYLVSAAALQADEKIIVSGNWGYDDRELTRFEEYDDGAGFIGYRADDSFVAHVELTPDLIKVIKVQTDQHILVGGSLTGGITRLDPTGAVDPTFLANINGEVTDILLQPNGKILVAGNFTQVNGSLHPGIARLNTDGSIDNSFQVNGLTDLPEDDGFITKLAITSSGQIIVAGSFYSHVGSARKNLARLLSDGSLDCSFDPGTGTNRPIDDMILQPDDKILIAGDFSSYNSIARNGLARVNNSTSIAITIDSQPQNSTVCAGDLASFTTSASGTTNIQYQWQFSIDGVAPFSDISNGGGYTNVNGAALQVNTSGGFGVGFYRCHISGDFVADAFTNNAQLVVTPLPSAPGVTDGSTCSGNSVTLTASGGASGQYRWYANPTGSTLATTSTNNTFVTPPLTVTTNYYVAINNGLCESPRTQVTAVITGICNFPPEINTTTITIPVQGNVTIDLLPLLSDPNNDLDLSTLAIIVQPASGAVATITGTLLFIDYSNVSFSGTDALRISVCDLNGSCTEQDLNIEVVGTMTVYNALSPGNDGKNDILYLEYIDILETTKDNKVTIFNRWGDIVFEVDDYNNTTRVFRGQNNNGNDLPSGNYFYKIEFFTGLKTKTGYLSLKR